MRVSEAGPGWTQQVPPWFGNIGYFLGLGGFGLLMAILGAVAAAFIGVALHALGKCLVWPALCSFCTDPEPDCTADDDSADTGRNAE